MLKNRVQRSGTRVQDNDHLATDPPPRISRLTNHSTVPIGVKFLSSIMKNLSAKRKSKEAE